jgi:hypothetical protein
MPRLGVWLLLIAVGWAVFIYIGLGVSKTIHLVAQAIGG